ncbi:putative pectate lyase P59 [Cucurbita argyrosperma subsp. argyrosperma]|nr:putative pectate lyase P59 [Cucurbita argyrosperma subsp. argyrosperma]
MIPFRALFLCSLLFVVVYSDAPPDGDKTPDVEVDKINVTDTDTDKGIDVEKADEYWQKRAAEAQKAAQKAFNPDPDSVADNFNAAVGQEIVNSNNSRRSLRRYRGPCLATNPIDRCWRCDPNWDKNRKKLAECPLGFGHQTIGGKRGPIYVVTDASDENLVDPKPGTLRHAVVQNGPRWIIFGRSMIIRLSQELIISSNKTIDARGFNVHIAFGAGLTLQFVHNIIIHGLHIHDIISKSGGMIRDAFDHYGFRTQSDGDGISIFGGSHIWIDHVSMYNCQDGLIDAIMGSTAITISNSHFTHHNEVMLFGASDSYKEDSIMQITLAFNHFGRGLVQRMPRCRFGFFHVVNNDYTHWLMYAIGGSQHPTIVSQGNRFIAPPNPSAKQITKREYADESEWKNWSWRSEGDLMINGAYFVPAGDQTKGKKSDFSRYDMIKFKPGAYVKRLTRFAGTLECQVGKPC